MNATQLAWQPVGPSQLRRPKRATPAITVAVWLWLGAWAAVLIGGCGPGTSNSSASDTGSGSTLTESAPLRVLAASSLRPALTELAAAYAKHTGTPAPTLIFGASGTLTAQLLEGAEADVFLSADIDYPQRLVQASRCRVDDTFTYARGRLVVWVRKDSALSTSADALAALKDPRVQRIAIANPKLAPYGRTAERVLRELGVGAPLATGQNVEEAAHFAMSGAAELGLVPYSLANSAAMRDAGVQWELPPALNASVLHGGAIVAAGPRVATAVRFREFLTSPAGREILARHGLTAPTP